jgi:phosphoribosylanthranilate isomerase
MRRIRVKICGITNLEDAMMAAALGADALGFIFTPSPRRVDLATARRIVGSLPPFITKIGVFKDESIDRVLEVMNYVGLEFAQLHGAETPESLQPLGRRAIKVFHVTGPEVLDQIKRFQPKTFMLDLPKDYAGSILDQGDIVRAAAMQGRLILAGRLAPDNVKEAIINLEPFAVDVARGVEEYPGKKSRAMMEAFFERVREAEREISTT